MISCIHLFPDSGKMPERNSITALCPSNIAFQFVPAFLYLFKHFLTRLFG